MKLINLTCPNCNGTLQVNEELSKCTCPFCGGEVLVDHEKVILEHSEASGYNFAKGMYRAQMEQANEVMLKEFPVRTAAKVQGKSVLYLVLMLVCGLIALGMFAWLRVHDIPNWFVVVFAGFIALAVLFYKKHVAYKHGGAYLVKSVVLTNKRVIISYVNKPDLWFSLFDLIEVRESYFGTLVLRTFKQKEIVWGIKDIGDCVMAINNEKDKWK